MTSRSRTGSLKFNIVGDISDLKNKLGQIERNTGTTSRKLSQAGTLIKGAFGVAAVKQIGEVALALDQLGRESEAIRNRFDVVFGESADDIAEWADTVNERFGVSVERVQDLANGVADLLVPLGFTRQEAAGLTQETLQLANALSEWSGGNIDVVDSTERIRKALLGERESLEALGVKVLQSDVNARLAAEGNDKLTGAAKARAEAEATLAIITDKSTDALKAYADGANEALIQQKALTAVVEDARSAFGDLVKREGDDARDFLSALALVLDDVTDALNNTADGATDTSDANRGLIRTLAETAIEMTGIDGIAESLAQRYIDNKLAVEANAHAVDAAGVSAQQYAAYLQDTSTSAGNAASGVDDVTQSIKELQTAERAATDPIFALRQANEKLNEAFEKRVQLQAQGAGTGAINEAIQDELEAAQDLEFARQNLNDVGADGLDILDDYADKYAIGTEAIRAYKDEVLGLRDALNGLPSSITLPTINADSDSVRSLEEELNRRGRATVE